jgi:type VI secretion system protein ImpL
MKSVLKALGSAIGILVIVALILSVCLWWFGPLLGFGDARPLETVMGRVIAIGVVWILTLVAILLIMNSSQRREEQLVKEVSAPETAGMDGDDELVTAELEEMGDKLRSALKRLRKSSTREQNLTQMPWYMIIGPPGAGKTTAISSSGLQFPLADDDEVGALSGVGGTRNCDWWLTNEAVLLDTAGRYTTQDSEAEADQAAWLGFLKMLRRNRPRQAINGAIIAISLSDLANQDEATQEAHAAAIRKRLHELRDTLRVTFPVYILFTKADLIAGFAEFFEGLSKEERAQVWGATFDLPQGKRAPSPIESFGAEFDALVQRLNEQMIARMEREIDPERRSLIAGFPAQVASIKPVAEAFLSEVFRENVYQMRAIPRGVYFTSGTQEGTPIDRLMMGMSRTFGIGRQAIGSGRGSGRSYFLTNLFSNVMFPEAGLVSNDDRVERRYRWTRRAAFAAVGIVSVAIGGFWVRSYMGNAVLAEQTEARIQQYVQAASVIPGSPIADSDLPLVLPALNLLENVPGTDPGSEAPQALQWGLYQGDSLANESAQAYRAALNQHYLPRLILRLEERMQSNVNSPEYLYDALKVYLMLGLAAPRIEADAIKEWFATEWELSYPGAAREADRLAMARHLDALLSQPMKEIILNQDLVIQVQDVLSRLPMATRVYNGIINSAAAKSVPDWRLTDVGGPSLNRAIVRSSGKAMNEGIPGIFTREGFHGVFLPEAVEVASRVQGESWILGASAAETQSDAALIRLSRDVLDLYYEDYVRIYNEMMADVNIIPLTSLEQAVEVTNILSGPTSPLAYIITAMADETQLSVNPIPQEDEADAGATGAAPKAPKVKGVNPGLLGAAGNLAKRRFLSTESRVFLEAVQSTRGLGPDGLPPPPGSYVDNEFAWLQAVAVAPDGQPSQLDQLLAALGDVYRDLNRLVFTGGVGNPAESSNAVLQFRQVAGRLPEPMQRWGSQIAVGSSGIATQGTRAGIDARWQSDVLPVCKRVTENTYPFNRRSRTDSPLPDFTRLFSPGGLIDAFFEDVLKPHVDMSTQPWSWRTTGGADLGISQEVLTQIQHAAAIRDAFFPLGPQPQVAFQMTPYSLDPNAREVILEVHGQPLTFSQRDGAPRPTQMLWPGSSPFAQVTFERPKRNSENVLNRDGPWAIFRLMDAAELRRTNAQDRKRVIFTVGGRIAIFDMQSSAALNPFTLGSLSAFRCPSSF